MEIDIQLLPSPPDSDTLIDRTVVVIDVLRATSVIVQAISQGALEILPSASAEEAFQMAKVFPQDSILLGGERESKKVPGFDLGNSPKEYVAERIRGKKLILATTNGTKARLSRADLHRRSGDRQSRWVSNAAPVRRADDLDPGSDRALQPHRDGEGSTLVSARLSGSSTRNVLPAPGALSTSMLP